MSALVTGAGRGLGRATAELLASSGQLTYVADLDLAAAELVASGIEARGGRAVAVAADVSLAGDVRALVDRASSQEQLEVVVNNAGVARRSPLVDTSDDDLDLVISVNVRGAFLVVREAARVLSGQGAGCIVNVASTSAYMSSRVPMVVYDMTKAAVRQLTVSAAHELAPFGVRVNAVGPGTVPTDLVAGLRAPDAAAHELDASVIPMRRFGTPLEIAHAVCFLASDEASYITGHTLVVDGGWLT